MHFVCASTQHLSRGLYWYNLVKLSFYWTLVLLPSTESHRTYYTALVIHHFCAIILITTSWILNFVRFGSLIMLVHDAIIMEVKITKQAYTTIFVITCLYGGNIMGFFKYVCLFLCLFDCLAVHMIPIYFSKKIT